MYKLKITFFLLYVLFKNDVLIAQTSSFSINLSKPSNMKNDINGFCFSVKILKLNDTIENVILPHCLNWAYSSSEFDSTENNGIWIIEKLQQKKYTSHGIRNEVNDHGGKCYDSLGYELYNTLSIDSPISYKKSLFGYYDFKNGKYRAMVKIFISKGEIKSKTEISSSWVYFNVRHNTNRKCINEVLVRFKDGLWLSYQRLDRWVGEHGGDWINENINPLTPVVEFISGKAYIKDKGAAYSR